MPPPVAQTDFDALEALYPLPPSELYRQWLLTREEAEIPTEWQRWCAGGWYLGAHPDAHVCELRDNGGRGVGWVIEPQAYLRATSGELPSDSLILPLGAECTPAEIERALYGRDARGQSSGEGLEGMWVAIILSAGREAPLRRVYLGSVHSVVFGTEERVVAATPNLIPGITRDRALSRAFDLPARQSFYPFGLTPFHGVRRLLPNHYLDLDNFEAVRHWPKEGFEPLADGATGARRIVDHSRRIIGALAQAHRSFTVFLSAGRDSRAVLALVKPFVDSGAIDVTLSTSVGDDLESRTDGQAARQLARIAGLPHDVAGRRRHEGAAPDVLRAFARIGEALSGPSLSKPGAQRREGDEDLSFKLAGMGGEAGRAYYWAAQPSAERLTPELVTDRLRMPGVPQVIGAARAWLDGLPPGVRDSVPDTLDLAYVEQRLGGWEAPARYLFPGKPRVSSPMTAAFNVETMLRLPVDYRRAGWLQRDMVAYGWPELLGVPFNEPQGWLHLVRLAGQARFHLGGIRRRWFRRS